MVWTVLAVMTAAGVLGGVVNVAVSSGDKADRNWILPILAGLGAAYLIPLFLQTVSSQLLVDLFSNGPHHADLLVFGAFCLLASISSKAFIQTLSDTILREAKQANQSASEAKQQAQRSQEKSEQTAMWVAATRDEARFGLEPGVPDEGAQFPEVPPGPVHDDPWAGQFGGSPEVGGRLLEADISPMPGRPEWSIVCLTVRSTEAARPVDGPVQFYLHPTFGNSKPIVPVVAGKATLTFASWGAFVVGALVDRGATQLELDLAAHPLAREPWRSQ